jgi:hypothetical protein
MSKTKIENKLPVVARSDGFEQCCICGNFFKNINWHHTIPRSCGGHESLQIPLDGSCHTTLHAKADAVVARIGAKKSGPLQKFWSDETAERRAEVWLKILVDALLRPPVSSNAKMTLLPMVHADPATRQGLELLKKDLAGITNMEQTLLFCINFTLSSKGYKKNGKELNYSEDRTKNSGKSINRRKTNLW